MAFSAEKGFRNRSSEAILAMDGFTPGKRSPYNRDSRSLFRLLLPRQGSQLAPGPFGAKALHGFGTQIKITMSDLTVEKIIEIHDEIILKFEGAKGVLSESTLHFMVFRVNKIQNIFKRAATVLHAIGSQHPFVDGNKRTALVVAEKSSDTRVFILQRMRISSLNSCWQ